MNENSVNNDNINNASPNNDQVINNNMNSVNEMNSTFNSNNKSKGGIIKYIILALVVVAICIVEYFVVSDMSSSDKDSATKEQCEKDDSTDNKSNVTVVEKVVRLPYAKETIQPRTEITEEMIDYIKIPESALKDIDYSSIIMDESNIVGKYSNINTVIPKGSVFYSEVVIDKKDLSNSNVYEQKEGETLVYFPVTMASTYANSIKPDDYIYLYIWIPSSNGNFRVGKLASRVQVTAVKDINGQDVFEDSSEKRIPAYIIFALPDKEFTYYEKVREKKYRIEPVPVNIEYSGPSNSTVMTDSELMTFIDHL